MCCVGFSIFSNIMDITLNKQHQKLFLYNLACFFPFFFFCFFFFLFLFVSFGSFGMFLLNFAHHVCGFLLVFSLVFAAYNVHTQIYLYDLVVRQLVLRISRLWLDLFFFSLLIYFASCGWIVMLFYSAFIFTGFKSFFFNRLVYGFEAASFLSMSTIVSGSHTQSRTY